MTRWEFTSGDILDIGVDVLVCSANPYLDLSGGVGGAFALRFGQTMQHYLHAHLKDLGTRHVTPGTVVQAPPCGSPFKAVLHAVAVDAMYDSSPQRISRVVERIFAMAHEVGATSVALPALATGYGHLTIEQFAEGLRPLINRQLGVDRAVVCLRHEDDAVLVREVLSIGLK